MATQAGGRRPSKKLVVLSGAAIFAVYVAGYARTQAAADQWQTTTPPLPSAATSSAAAGSAAATSSPPPNPAPTTPPAAAAAGTACAAVAPATTYGYGDDGGRGRDREGDRGDRGDRRDRRAAPATQATCPPGSSQGSTAGSPATQPSSQAAPAPASGQAQGQPATGQAAAPAAASTYKDGVYSGTGWSRHGSVSVALTIKSGKITSVVVTGCTTHYPCGDVAPMTSEVLAAQSLQVDTVSGATDSSLAFLGGVQQALTAAQG